RKRCQAKLLFVEKSGIFPLAWAKALPSAKTAMHAPTTHAPIPRAKRSQVRRPVSTSSDVICRRPPRMTADLSPMMLWFPLYRGSIVREACSGGLVERSAAGIKHLDDGAPTSSFSESEASRRAIGRDFGFGSFASLPHAQDVRSSQNRT